MSSLETGLEQHLLRRSTTTAIAKDQHIKVYYQSSLNLVQRTASEATQSIVEPDK